jgi:DNA repair protein RecN (Recombination protein N)
VKTSLTRVVSGGELSRLMLAIKTLTARTGRGATLIFDEVDRASARQTPWSEAAGLGRGFQVLCITHLPQIAAYANWHYRIESGAQWSDHYNGHAVGDVQREEELAG